MKTFGDLFSGGGGATVGAIASGYTPIFGVEYDPRIAAIANHNLGGHVRVMNVLEANPLDFPRVDLLHASPPCPSFSTAKVGGEETELDIALARKVAEFITIMRPRSFTTENVQGYRHSQSFKIICNALRLSGYQYRVVILNAQNYGVPQSRVRLFVMASLGILPSAPLKTHSAATDEQETLFEKALPAPIGWYEAIEDLIPTLPLAYKRKGLPCPTDPIGVECRQSAFRRGHFAPWQEARIGSEYKTLLACVQGEASDYREETEPSPTIASNHSATKYRALLVGAGGYDGDVVSASPSDPSFVVTANQNQQNQIRALLVGGANTSEEQAAEGVGVSKSTETARCVNASNSKNWKAFIVNGTENNNGKSVTLPQGDAPMFSVVAQTGQRQIPRAFIVPDGNEYAFRPRVAHEPCATLGATNKGKACLESGRIVQMTTRALARFQTVPDLYVLSGNNALDCKIIGNAVPCLLYQRIVEAN